MLQARQSTERIALAGKAKNIREKQVLLGKQMILTEDQVKVLEQAFSAYPKDHGLGYKWTTMEGINEQLKNPEDKDGKQYVCYVSKIRSVSPISFSIEKLYEES